MKDWSGHGTAVNSLAAGRYSSPAPRANLYVIKITNPILDPQDEPYNFDGTWEPAAVLAGLRHIRQAIEVGQLPPHRTVINMSFGAPISTMMEKWKPKKFWKFHRGFSRMLQFFERNHIAVVNAAGNTGEQRYTETALFTPQVYMTTRSPHILVGAVDDFGMLQEFTTPSSPGINITVYAPGKDIWVFDPDTGRDILGSGTSYSAPLVAGMIAYFWSHPRHSTAMRPYWDRTPKEMLRGTAYMRTPSGYLEEMERTSLNPNSRHRLIPVIYNLVHGMQDDYECWLRDARNPRPENRPSPLALLGRDTDTDTDTDMVVKRQDPQDDEPQDEPLGDPLEEVLNRIEVGTCPFPTLSDLASMPIQTVTVTEFFSQVIRSHLCYPDEAETGPVVPDKGNRKGDPISDIGFPTTAGPSETVMVMMVTGTPTSTL